MKKLLLYVSVAALTITGFTGCGHNAGWTRQERQAMRNMLRDYRTMTYLNDLTDAEYMLFSDNVTEAIEDDYPVYTSFVQLPGVNDTVQVYVVTTIVEELNTDARNMRHIFPYQYLVGNNILPSGLDRTQQNAFYNCLSQKVNATYPSVTSFVNAVIADTTANSQMARMQGQCANDLFDWTVEIIEVSEVSEGI